MPYGLPFPKERASIRLLILPAAEGFLSSEKLPEAARSQGPAGFNMPLGETANNRQEPHFRVIFPVVQWKQNPGFGSLQTARDKMPVRQAETGRLYSDVFQLKSESK